MSNRSIGSFAGWEIVELHNIIKHKKKKRVEEKRARLKFRAEDILEIFQTNDYWTNSGDREREQSSESSVQSTNGR